MLNSRWWLLLLFCTAIMLLLLSLPTEGRWPVQWPDSSTYLAWSSHRTPAYPAFLTLVQAFLVLEAVPIIQVLVAGAAFAVIPLFARPISGGTLILALVAMICFCDLELSQYNAAILTESLSISFLIFWMLTRSALWKNSNSTPYLITALVADVLLVLLRPGFMLLPFISAALFAAAHLFQKNTVRLRPADLRASIVCFSKMIAPVIISLVFYCTWQLYRTGEFTISSTGRENLLGRAAFSGYLETAAEKPDASILVKDLWRSLQSIPPPQRGSVRLLVTELYKIHPELLNDRSFSYQGPLVKEILSGRKLEFLVQSLSEAIKIHLASPSRNYAPPGYTEKIRWHAVANNRIIPAFDRYLPSIAIIYTIGLLLLCGLFWFKKSSSGLDRRDFGTRLTIILSIAAVYLTTAIWGLGELRRQTIPVLPLVRILVGLMFFDIFRLVGQTAARYPLSRMAFKKGD